MQVLSKAHQEVKGTMKVHVFDDLGELFGELENLQPHYRHGVERASWNSLGQFDDCVKLMHEGDQETLGKVKDSLKETASLLAPLTKKRKRINGPFGVLNTAAYLAGHPTPCKRRVKRLSDQGPVNIWMDMGTVCDMTNEQLGNYRMVIVAFAAALAETRQVNLNAFKITGTCGKVSSGVCFPVPLRPLDAVSATVLGHPALYRGLIMDYVRQVAGCSPHDCLPIVGSSKAHAVYFGAKRGDIITPNLMQDIYSTVIENRTPAAAAKKLMEDFLSGEGFVFEVYDGLGGALRS